jgi:anti-sigma regulatory factor (Ser/Thr protein kinase)
MPASAADVRQRIRQELAKSGGTFDPPAVEDTLLVASELATNAIVHGGGITGFHVRVADGVLHVAVSDRSDRTPTVVARAPGDLRPGGFGWPIIRLLALGVDVRPHAPGGPRGKTITVTLPLR